MKTITKEMIEQAVENAANKANGMIQSQIETQYHSGKLITTDEIENLKTRDIAAVEVAQANAIEAFKDILCDLLLDD